VLNQGTGLSQEHALECLRLPDDRLDELLDLAHEVRLAWCGDEVAAEGIVSVKTGGCREDCHFCSQPASSTHRTSVRDDASCCGQVTAITVTPTAS
jgi:biotin synthase